MNSIAFPNIFSNSSTNVITDHEATVSNLKLLLLSNRTGLFGDPYYGTNIKRKLFDENDDVLKDILIDDIYTAIKIFMPQLVVTRKDIKIDNGTKDQVKILISGLNLIDYQTNLYVINLTESISEGV